MEFSLDETQQAVASLTAQVLGKAGPIAPDEPNERGVASAAWQAMARAGLLGLLLPSTLGGDGLGVLEAAALLTEVGKRTADVPALATLALGVLPVVRRGSGAQQQALLPKVATGDRILTAALHEPGNPLPATPRTVARRDQAALVVSGTKIGVPYAALAHRMLVSVSIAGIGGAVVLVDPQAEGVRLRPTHSAGSSPEYAVSFDGVRVADDALLGGGADGAGDGDGAADAAVDVAAHAATIADLNTLAVVGSAAVADGVLAGALELTAGHIGSREQFGKPLAAFQAVAQQVADVYVAARTMHLLAWSAAWRLASGRDAEPDATVAAYWLAEELVSAMHVCQHLHGGVGMDVTYAMHRYYGWAKDLARGVGGTDDRMTRLGALVAEGA